jgi:hypothetical protein
MKFNFNKKQDNLPPIEYINIQPKKKTNSEKAFNLFYGASTMYCVWYTAFAQINDLRSSYYNNKTELLPPDVGVVERLKIVDQKNIKELKPAKIELVYDEGVTVPNNCSITLIKTFDSKDYVLSANHCFDYNPDLKQTNDTGSVSEESTQYDKNGKPYSDYAIVMPRKVFDNTYPNFKIVEFEEVEIKSKRVNPSIVDSLNTIACDNTTVDSKYVDIGATKIIETNNIKRIFLPGNSGSLIYQYLKSNDKNVQSSKLCLSGMVISGKFGKDKNGKTFFKNVTMFSPDLDPTIPWKQKIIQVKK